MGFRDCKDLGLQFFGSKVEITSAMNDHRRKERQEMLRLLMLRYSNLESINQTLKNPDLQSISSQ